MIRTVYMIDRHRVVHEVHEVGGDWHCECEEFKSMRECRHTRESEGRRAAQAMITARVRSVNGTLQEFTHHDVEPRHLSKPRRK